MKMSDIPFRLDELADETKCFFFILPGGAENSGLHENSSIFLLLIPLIGRSGFGTSVGFVCTIPLIGRPSFGTSAGFECTDAPSGRSGFTTSDLTDTALVTLVLSRNKSHLQSCPSPVKCMKYYKVD